MLSLYYLIVLSIIQGITEFLPISSSGHLVLMHGVMDGLADDASIDAAHLIPVQSADIVGAVAPTNMAAPNTSLDAALRASDTVLSGHSGANHSGSSKPIPNTARAAYNKTLDIAMHLGTLVAVCVYFYRDVLNMIFGGFDILLRRQTKNARMALTIIIASLPVIAAGLILHKLWGASMFDSALVVGWATVIFGVVLWVCDKMGTAKEGQQQSDEKRSSQALPNTDTLTLRQAFVIGLAQCFALIPGTSRSGITMSAARAFGMPREEAARFALWLGMVAISGAASLAGLDLITNAATNTAHHMDFLIAAVLSAVMAFVSIALMMRWIGRIGFLPFVIYRLVLGGIILSLVYAGILV